MQSPKILITLAVAVAIATTVLLVRPKVAISPVHEGEYELTRYGLETDTSQRSIELSDILSGGPGKDGIPAIYEPAFTTIEEADFEDDALGIFVEFEGVRRFYPYAILVWHEIVNDHVGDTHFAVTFCPLCGSGIVFDRNVDSETLTFGVSGLLFESNLLMYDTKTESLWSQARNQAVVGPYTRTKLEILPMQLLTFDDVRSRYPNTSVLSKETGHRRDYERNPYSGYEEDETLYFPVSVTDQRFNAKEIMYVIPFDGKSYAFPQLALNEGDNFDFDTEGVKITLRKSDAEVHATVNEQETPGYYEMWFSWATHHQEDGRVLNHTE